MTQSSQPDRLDRIEALLEQTAQIAASNARAIQASSDEWRQQRNDIQQFLSDLTQRSLQNL